MMKDFTKNIIRQGASIVEAMKKLNELSGSLTLFVVNNMNRLIGTLTDGDVRRGFIHGLALEDPVDKFMCKSFVKLNSDLSLHSIRDARAKGIRLLPVLNDEGEINKVFDLKNQKSILPLECVLMAGGRGERLRPLTDRMPKPMLPIGEKPIIEHSIDRLISFGVEKIHIAVNYLGQQIVDYLGDGSTKGISIDYLREEGPLGTAGALSLLDGVETDYIILMNCDLFTDADFEDLYINTLQHDAVLGIATVPYSTKIPYGIVDISENQVIGLKEKPIYTHYANAGIYLIRSDVLAGLERNTFLNITELIEKFIVEGHVVVHNPIVGYWVDIGQHQDYLNAQEIIKHIQQ